MNEGKPESTEPETQRVRSEPHRRLSDSDTHVRPGAAHGNLLSNAVKMAAERFSDVEVPVVPGKRASWRVPLPKPVRSGLRVLGAVTTLVFVIVFTATNMKPIYTDTSVVTSLVSRDTLIVKSSPLARLLASAEFNRDKAAFKEDLIRTGRMDPARADTVATIAVREAYLNDISPAIIFGVMLTENARFIAGAQSDVGAVGLMQVYPKVWLPVLGDSLGRDLGVDSTNLRYGVRILNKYFYPRNANGKIAKTRSYQTALLRYNGCVSGSHTPNCHTYPDKVRNYVSHDAVSICRGKSFDDCIAKPFIAGLLGDTAILERPDGD